MNEVKVENTNTNHTDLPSMDSGETTEMLKSNDVPKPIFQHPDDDHADAEKAAPPGTGGRNMDGNKKGRRADYKKKWNQAWYEFCENTTLHGLKQVAEPQPFIIRRLIWVVLVLAGSSLFLYQMITGIVYYYTYPVSVNVKINYNETILFPALTICNQNAFRKTVAAERRWYGLISDVFSDSERHHHVGEENVDYNASLLTVARLFNTTGHAFGDLVVRCSWDGNPCSGDDFLTTMTDYGKCYTFNSVKPKHARKTGTEGGLQLLLNVEQYEYMPGPNQGAGLRVLLHNHNDAPLIRDFGIAVPPGSYSLLGTTMIRIDNLPKPHGQCDDTRSLKYYTTYSKLNCMENCKQVYIQNTCGCRHVNMVDGEVTFNKEERPNCDCPIPCQVDSLEQFNSIGYISAFDALNLFHSNLTRDLEPKYKNALEVSQRVDEKAVHRNTKLIRDLGDAVVEVERALDEVMDGLQYIESYITDKFTEMEERINFHRVKGLNKVKYIMEHDFVRGWTILEERTLPFLTFDFYELRGSFKRAIDLLAASQNGTEEEKTLAMSRWLNYQNSIQERLDITIRVIDNVTEVHEKYKSGDPLLTFKASRNRRYDRTWITVELLQAIVDDDLHDQDNIYSELFRRLDQIIESMNGYLDMGNNFTKTYEIDHDFWKKMDKVFRDGCVFYNYNIFLYKTRIVDGPVIVIDRKIEEFEILDRNMLAAKSKLLLGIITVKESIRKTRETVWTTIKHVLEDSELYLTDLNSTKLELAEHLTSKDMVQSIRDVELFFSDLRSAGRSTNEKMQDLKIALEKMWTNMLSEYTTAKFYEKVHEDFVDFPNDNDYYLPYFANLLGVKTSSLTDTSEEELLYRLNADFNVTNISSKITEIEDDFGQLINYTNIGRILGVRDETFLYAMTSFKDSLEIYLEGSKIDTDFYLTNFIQLNVFMQELSYEEIVQQPAYDMLNLLGDIGGSVGLFLGASALTLAEITDVLVMQFVNVFT